MKTIILNGSPRKNWNTAMMLKEAQKGAESVGTETEYIDLFDLSYTGCRSCLACKRKDAERCKCFWKDDLSPLIDRILSIGLRDSSFLRELSIQSLVLPAMLHLISYRIVILLVEKFIDRMYVIHIVQESRAYMMA